MTSELIQQNKNNEVTSPKILPLTFDEDEVNKKLLYSDVRNIGSALLTPNDICVSYPVYVSNNLFNTHYPFLAEHGYNNLLLFLMI